MSKVSENYWKWVSFADKMEFPFYIPKTSSTQKKKTEEDDGNFRNCASQLNKRMQAHYPCLRLPVFLSLFLLSPNSFHMYADI